MAVWRRIQVWRRRLIWKRRSKTNLLLNPEYGHVWSDAAAGRFLLEQVERYGKNLPEKLEALVEEEGFVSGLRDGVDWDGGEAQMSDWGSDLEELIEKGLVVQKERDGKYALTHDGWSQLHSLRSFEQTRTALEIAVSSRRIAGASLAIVLASPAVAGVALVLSSC